MKEEEEKERAFKVQDRRRFSAEGEAKSDVEDAPEKPAQTADAESQAQQSSTIGGGAAQQASRAQAAQNPASEPELNFATFLVGLSSEALGALGELPDPATGQPRRDLRAAQQLIDIIGMLRDKTRGNLDPTEQSLIDAILFDLRMKYVELARQPAR